MCTWNFHARRVNLPELAGLALKIYVAHWPAAGLLEAWLVLTSFKYHGNLYILIPLNQRLALTRLRATGPWKRLQRKCEWRLKFDLEPDDDRIVSHDAPRFMLYYHYVRDTLWSVTFSTREVNIDRSARCGWFPNMFRFSSFCFWDYRVG